MRGLTVAWRSVSGPGSYRTEGVSGAFIGELICEAALGAVRTDGKLEAETQHLDDALRELAVDGGEFTRSFLGFRLS